MAIFCLSLQAEGRKMNVDSATVQSNSMPLTFENTQPNVITDSDNSLYPFYSKLHHVFQLDSAAKQVVCVLQIGDSHVRSHEITSAFHALLADVFGNAAAQIVNVRSHSGIVERNGENGIISHCIGINGATSRNFLDETYIAKIDSLQPDLLIVSLGTNESAGNYKADSHYGWMEQLYSALKEKCPDAAILYTTPPGSFKAVYSQSRRRKNRRTVGFAENKNTRRVADTIVRFAAGYSLACWDLFSIAGGEGNACENWEKAGYFGRDKIHFSMEGYRTQGRLLYDALIFGYNEYLKNEHVGNY
jgi:lysophospholipase L1-like esterase